MIRAGATTETQTLQWQLATTEVTSRVMYHEAIIAG